MTQIIMTGFFLYIIFLNSCKIVFFISVFFFVGWQIGG